MAFRKLFGSDKSLTTAVLMTTGAAVSYCFGANIGKKKKDLNAKSFFGNRNSAAEEKQKNLENSPVSKVNP